MITLLARLFIRDHRNVRDGAVRRAYGVLCGAVGILLNMLLFAGKLLVGSLARSIAITADAFNNLSDALASFVTLIGFRLAGQKPDREHPFGHGRIEYLAGLAVAMLILLTGAELFGDSFDKILHPVDPVWSIWSVAVLLASIAVKGYMYCYNRAVGKKIDSAAMRAAARDSISDCVSTLAVLLTTVAAHFTPWHLDGICGLAVSCFILYSGFAAAKDTISPLLGAPPSDTFVASIRTIVEASPVVVGIHDLVVHDYGPGRRMISLHAEVPADGDILAVHDAIDNVEQELHTTLGCDATIHMDPIVTDDGVTSQTRDKVAALMKTIHERITIHDFRMVQGPTHTNIIFDAVLPFDCRMSEQQASEKIAETVKTLDAHYRTVVHFDREY